MLPPVPAGCRRTAPRPIQHVRRQPQPCRPFVRRRQSRSRALTETRQQATPYAVPFPPPRSPLQRDINNYSKFEIIQFYKQPDTTPVPSFDYLKFSTSGFYYSTNVDTSTRVESLKLLSIPYEKCTTTGTEI